MTEQVRRRSVFTFAPKKPEKATPLARPLFALERVAKTPFIEICNEHLSARTFLDRTSFVDVNFILNERFCDPMWGVILIFMAICHAQEIRPRMKALDLFIELKAVAADVMNVESGGCIHSNEAADRFLKSWLKLGPASVSKVCCFVVRFQSSLELGAPRERC